MTDDADSVSAHSDARGDLVAVELSRLGFEARRVFVVSGAAGGADRGDHVIPCRQLMVLISGSVSVRVGADRDHPREPVVLGTPGESLPLTAGEYIRYRLDDPSCVVLVLAEEVYHGTGPQ